VRWIPYGRSVLTVVIAVHRQLCVPTTMQIDRLLRRVLSVSSSPNPMISLVYEYNVEVSRGGVVG
jgi:hypothetical protein